MKAFIGGTPASGKSYLAKHFKKKSDINITLVEADKIRHNLRNYIKLRKWINIYWNMDERDFLENTTYDQAAKILSDQSEALFPKILEKFNNISKKSKNVIIEGVNLLPHLTKKHFDFPGIFLVCEDRAELFKRLKEEHRWGKTEELQKLEVDYFIEYENRYIKSEARKYGYKVFSDPREAEEELENIFLL